LLGRRKATRAEPCRRRSFHLHDHQRAVIGKRGVLGEPVDFVEDAVGHLSGGDFVMLFNQLAQALRAEQLAFAVVGFRDAIGMEDKDIARFPG